MKKFYITTAIDYVNSLPHIGTAYEKITADCIARAKRILGYDVRFCMGTDEHSINVKKKAIEEGRDPQSFCDRMVPHFEEIWKKLSISYDDFIRTTEERHKISVRELFRRIDKAGDIFTADYKGWYCEGCESFIQEKDLVDGKCPNHMKEPSWIEEQNYFFKLSNYGDWLLEHIRKNPGFIRPESRKNEIVKLIEGGLEDISVSRSGFDWGIPFPGDNRHVVYVWFDAVINYISSLGFGSDDLTEFEQYWDNAEVCHIIGKDITRFHCVMWPAMLKSAGVKIPDSVFGHGFIYHRGEKMSKSLGNVVSPLDIVDRFGPDPLRFFLLREVVYGNDGDFTYDRFIDRYNSDLANDLGNLVSRTISMIHKYLGGKFTIPDSESSVLKKRSKVLIKQSKIDLKKDFPKLKDEWENCINEFQLSNACNETWDYIRKANRYIEQQAPWKLAKDPDKKDELIGILYDLASAICGISILLYPYMPSSCEKIWKAFGNKGSLSEFSFDMLGERCDISAPIGVEIENIGALFPRIEEEKTVAEETKKPDALEEKSDDEGIITFEDFLKLDIRIGTVKQAEKIEGSKKLLRLRIDDGMGGRQVIAGIAEHFEPEDLVGKQVAFVANLKPRKMMGEYSQGMVLAAEDSGKFSILMPSAGVSPGAKVS